MKKIIVILVLGILCFVQQAAQANVISVSPAPAVRTVNANAPAYFTLVWRATSNTAGGRAATYTVEADDASVFLGSVNGTLLDTITTHPARTLSQAGTAVVSLPDSISLSRSVIRQAAESGQPLVIRRSFTDNGFGTAFEATMTVNVMGGVGADLSVSRLHTTFENGAESCAIKPNENLIALTEVNAEGTGILRGAWQVRTGNAYGVFRTLKAVQFPVHAGQDITLKSPLLPTEKSGTIDVRFKLESPDVSFTEPVITCAVIGNDAVPVKPPVTGKIAVLITPPRFAPLTAATEISWQPVKDAKQYRVEILPDAKGEPIAVQTAKAKTTKTKLSPLTLEKLDPQKRYIIRVTAL
jgi:hypothetical protein